MLSSPKLREGIEEQMCNVISSEAKTLCSAKSPSCLRTPTEELMLNFSWGMAGKEIEEKAPFLHKVLNAAASPKFVRDQTDVNRYPGICLAAGILLKLRDPAMSLIPYVISLMLKAGGLAKKVNDPKSNIKVVFCLKERTWMSQATLLQKKGKEMSLNTSLQYQINAVYNTCQSLPKKPSNLRNCKMAIQPLINNEEN